MKNILISLLLLVALNLPASAKRVALVIGNGDYQFVTPLINPTNDAALMEKALKKAGFDVMRRDNLDQQGMRLALVEFSRKLKQGAEAGMFYYAGHGVEIDGKNYLVPVDSNMQSKEEADVFNFDVNSFLAMMENSGVPFNIMVLDACRNNPFRGMRATGGGLAPLRAPVGSYVAYATAPGSVAADGEGANSPFTEALAASMATPGLSLEEVFKQTRTKVRTATAGAQVPFDSSAIEGNFFFTPAVQKQEAVVVADSGEEAFQAAGDDLTMLRVVAEEFANTIWGRVARERIKSLESAAKSTEEPKVAIAAPAPEPPPAINPSNDRKRARLGIKFLLVTDEIAKKLSMAEPKGIVVLEVLAGSMAQAAGLKAQDVILEFNQVPLTQTEHLSQFIAKAEIGSTVKLKFLRGGNEYIVFIVIVEEPGTQAEAVTGPTSMVIADLGMTVEVLSSDLRKKFGVRDDIKGLIITAVDQSGPAQLGGVAAGDVIVDVVGTSAVSPIQIVQEIANTRNNSSRLVAMAVVKKGESGSGRYAVMELANP